MLFFLLELCFNTFFCLLSGKHSKLPLVSDVGHMFHLNKTLEWLFFQEIELKKTVKLKPYNPAPLVSLSSTLSLSFSQPSTRTHARTHSHSSASRVGARYLLHSLSMFALAYGSFKVQNHTCALVFVKCISGHV